MTALKIATIVLLGCFVVSPALSESNDCLHRSVPLNIIAWKPTQVPPLTPASLDVYLQGNVVSVNSVKLDQSPRRILILVDVSGSFLGKYDWITYLTTDLLDHVPPPNEIGLATFDESLQLLVAPTTNHDALSRQIATAFTPANLNLPRKHKLTALWDAISGSVNLLGPHHLGDVILAITDGMDNKSKTSAENVRDSLLAQGIRLFTNHIIDTHFAARSGMQEQNSIPLMGSLSSATGGLIINPQVEGEAPPAKGKYLLN